MLITIAICTRNRADQLREVLESLTDLTPPVSVDWEVLIVDNGSSDHTQETIASFHDRLSVRSVVEPQAGLSNARNRAVTEANGNYICWTDDDVRLDRGWLAAYAAAILRNPDASVFGGPIVPVLQGETPDWLVKNRSVVGHLLAERDFGPNERDLGDTNRPYGANFALRIQEQRRFRYDPELGVGPGRNRLGEETAVISDILLAGGRGVWVPEARVHHLIPQSRQTLAYVYKYNLAAGETLAYQSFLRAGRRKRFPMWAINGLTSRLVGLGIGRVIKGHFSPLLVSELGYARGVIDFYVSRRVAKS